MGSRSKSACERTEKEETGEIPVWRSAVSMYQHGLGAVLFVKKGADVQRREKAVLDGFRTFPEAPEDVLSSMK